MTRHFRLCNKMTLCGRTNWFTRLFSVPLSNDGAHVNCDGCWSVVLGEV